MHLPKVLRFRNSQLSANQYFITFLVCGFIISYSWPIEYIVNSDDGCIQQQTSDTSSLINEYNQLQSEDFEPQINLAQKPMTAKKQSKQIIRPRYFR
jgi:hypothetical protein